MNKQYVRGNLSIFEADIAETYSRGLTYILGYVCYWGGFCMLVPHAEVQSQRDEQYRLPGRARG